MDPRGPTCSSRDPCCFAAAPGGSPARPPRSPVGPAVHRSSLHAHWHTAHLEPCRGRFEVRHGREDEAAAAPGRGCPQGGAEGRTDQQGLVPGCRGRLLLRRPTACHTDGAGHEPAREAGGCQEEQAAAGALRHSEARRVTRRTRVHEHGPEGSCLQRPRPMLFRPCARRQPPQAPAISRGACSPQIVAARTLIRWHMVGTKIT